MGTEYKGESAEIMLPLSKSESNRALMLQAWSGGKIRAGQLSEARDTAILQRLLFENTSGLYDAMDAGTSFRFMTAWLALSGRHALLTGSPRMQERPVRKLVNALKELGCSIAFEGKEGYPPLRFSGFFWSGKSILEISAPESSQFISALMLAAPGLPEGLEIRLDEKTGSFSYLELTAGMMQRCGLMVEINRKKIIIPNQNWPVAEIIPGADWSSASYFYGMLACKPVGSSFHFQGLQMNSLQGDRVMAALGLFWHIETSESSNGVWIRRMAEGVAADLFSFDFSDCPDLALSLICTCVASGVAGDFSGLSSLRMKESDRLQSIQGELKKIGINLSVSDNGEHASLKVNTLGWPSEPPVFETHNDHRIAMALAIIVAGHKEKAFFNAPEVVEKSFPEFWQEAQKIRAGNFL